MNKIILTGNIFKDLELKGESKKYLNFTLAVRRDYKNQNGEYESDFINAVVFGKSAEFMINYCQKGDKIMIEGALRNNKYTDKNGDTKYIENVYVKKIELIKSTTKKENENTTIKQDEIELTDEEMPF